MSQNHTRTIFGFSPNVDATATRLRSRQHRLRRHTGRPAGPRRGVERHLGGNWTGKIEYSFDFGTATSTTPTLLNSTPLAVSLVARGRSGRTRRVTTSRF